MNKIYFFLLVIILSITSCTTKPDTASTQTAQDIVSEEVISTTDEVYKISVINADLPSPRKEMQATLNEAAIVVNYGSPSVKGRAILGSLIPYDKIWRAGANEATTFETSTALKIQGQELPAGKYGLFIEAVENNDWTVIFNSVHEQWGAYDYDKTKDVLRINATTEMRNVLSETMDFVIEGNNLVLKWDRVVLPVAISL